MMFRLSTSILKTLLLSAILLFLIYRFRIEITNVVERGTSIGRLLSSKRAQRILEGLDTADLKDSADFILEQPDKDDVSAKSYQPGLDLLKNVAIP